jgi:metal-responsive CopG/Arc/MetJ family transcriptional regulator
MAKPRNKKLHKRNHDRASGMTQSSISLPEELFDRLKKIALREQRSRNNLITLFLEQSCRHYWREKGS